MAQRVSKPSPLVALEEIPLSTPYFFAMTSIIPSYQSFQSQAPGSSTLLISGRQSTFASPEPVTESVSVTATHAPVFQFIAPLTQGFASFDTHYAECSNPEIWIVHAQCHSSCAPIGTRFTICG